MLFRSYDNIRNTPEHLIDFKYCKSKQEYFYTTGANEIKYYKLNGCISDRKRYPLVFSSEDFDRAKPYYKLVLNNLKSVSDKIKFISIGYSYSDPLSKILLNKFDSYSYRERRWSFNVDPEVNENQLEYFSQNRICIIKLKSQEFFSLFKEWEESNAASFTRSKKISFYSADKTKIILPAKLLLKLSSSLVQLDDHYKFTHEERAEYYKGEEPSYGTILQNHDVMREVLLDNIKKNIINFVSDNTSKSIQIGRAHV